MDYPCGRFGDCSLNSFGSIVWTKRRTDAHTQTDADERYIPANRVGVSKYRHRSLKT